MIGASISSGAISPVPVINVPVIGPPPHSPAVAGR